MNKNDKQSLTTTFLAILLAGFISYGLAIAGEPQSEWLWRNVLGVIDE